MRRAVGILTAMRDPYLMMFALAGHGLVSETVSVFIALLGFAATVAVMTKFVRIPYTIALVLAGLAVAVLQAAPEDAVITEDLVIVLFLPPLLFQAGLHIDLPLLQRKAIAVVLLAVPGVIVSSVAVAAAIKPFLPDAAVMGQNIWLPALLFGAMFAATDPISVMAAFKTTGAPDGLKTMVEGESLFNDGTAVVLFLILLAAVYPGSVPQFQNENHQPSSAMVMAEEHSQSADEPHAANAPMHADEPASAAAANQPAVSGTGSISIADGIVHFVKVVGLGMVFGLGFGMMAFWLMSKLDDHILENTITVVLVWGSFIIAEHSGVSGVIAVAVAGLIMGNHGKKLAMTERSRETINTFWESIDFIVNSIVFLLIGFELQFIGGIEALLSTRVLMAVAAVYGATLAARMVMVYPMAMLFGQHWPKGWKHVIFWAGIKGAIPLALVLGLPAGPLRDFLVPVAFGVVLVSLLVQGLTMPWLMKVTNVSGTTDDDVHPDARATAA